MTVTAVVTSHCNPRGLRSILGQLLYQTRPPQEVIVVFSETEGWQEIEEDFRDRFESFQMVEDENRNDWGHEKRAIGLSLAQGDVIGWFNDDDSYSHLYVEKLLEPIVKGADIAYCSWSGVPHCEFRGGNSTSGNFLIRTRLAKDVGWRFRHYEADGEFINRASSKAGVIEKVPEILYRHNAGVLRDQD